MLNLSERSGKLHSLEEWLHHCRPGDRFIYYRGFLGCDDDLLPHERDYRDDIRKEAVRCYMTGDYELAQARVEGHSVFNYYIIKRAGRDNVRPLWFRRNSHNDLYGLKPHRHQIKRRAA